MWYLVRMAGASDNLVLGRLSHPSAILRVYQRKQSGK